MNIDDLRLHDALLESVELGPRRELTLRIFIPEVTTMTSRGNERRGTRVAVRFGGIENHPNVDRFFFGGPLRGQEDCIDRIEELRRNRHGWSIELSQRGRVAIKTSKLVSVSEVE